MKVVFFCGGLGSRLREHTATIPKPMVPIGSHPILWHLMKYYAHFGHREFVICLGYKGELIRRYFTDELACETRHVEHLGEATRVEIELRSGPGWTITLSDTGDNVSIGERLRRVRPFVADDEYFLANYSDGLSDLPLDQYLAEFRTMKATAGFVSVRPNHSFHTVHVDDDGFVSDITPANESEFWINGGFFAFKREIFDYLKVGEDLVDEPFHRLLKQRSLFAYRYRGFWACMDTLKDKKAFDEMDAQGQRPWQLW